MLAAPQAVLIRREFLFYALFVARSPVVDSFALGAGKFYKVVLRHDFCVSKKSILQTISKIKQKEQG